jgi:site-specific DNA-methyltransferase (adenine-specific)
MKLDVIHNKSCLSMDEVPDESIDILVTSPPYDVEKEYEKEKLGIEKYKAFTLGWMKEGKRVLKKGGRMCINTAATGRKPYAPIPDYISVWGVEEVGLLHRGVITWFKTGRRGDSTAWGSWMSASSPFLRDATEMIDILLKGGDPQSDAFSSVGEEFVQALKTADTGLLKKILMALRDPINDPIMNQIACFSKDSYKKPPAVEGQRSDITKESFLRDTISTWKTKDAPTSEDDKYIFDVEESTSLWEMRCETQIRWHPAPFPEELPRRLIQLFSFPGDVVLDPFGGSGQTAMACVSLPQKRHYILYETNKDYCAKAAKRIRSHDLTRLTDFI